MRRKTTRAVARLARRAVLAATGTFAIALAVGVSALLWTSPQATALEAATLTASSIDDGTTATPEARAASLLIPAGLFEDGANASAAVPIPVGDQAIPTTVEATPAPTPTALPTATPRPSATATADADIVRAAAVRATATALGAGAQASATLSYYYCQRGSRGIGDGGGFCGHMANGAVVYPGAAACARAYLGQRFRIEGDPNGTVYQCADTGSAVAGMHRDIWFATSDEGLAWLNSVGRRAMIEIIP